MTTRVEIEPGICKMATSVIAEVNDDDEVEVAVTTSCPNIKGMMSELGNVFDPFEVCLCKPGEGPLYEYAQENFPGHVSCIAINGITKAIEVEGKLALPCDCSIKFVDKG